MNHFDVLILGNGIIGCSTAFELMKKNPGLKIAIAGPSGRGGGASVAAGAMISCFAEATSQTFKTVPNQIKFDLCYQALKRWPRWLDKINAFLPPDDQLKIEQGTYVLLNSRSSRLDTDNYLAILKSLDHYEEPYEEIDPSDIEEINPLQGCRPLRALWIPNEGCISSHAVLGALQKALGNAAWFDHEASHVIVQGGAAIGVEMTGGERVYADQIVLAAGAFSQKILDQIPGLSDTMPLVFSGVGYSILVEQNQFRPIRKVVRTPNRAGACGLHALPRSPETVYIGASNDLSFYPHITPKIGMLNFLMECAIQQIDQQLTKSKFLGFHVGNRPASIDSFPLIGETSVKNLFLITGTYRDGFHQSPLLANHMAALLCGEKGIVPSLFNPQRPLIQVKDKKASTEEYLVHFQGSSYEHNLLLPTGILTDQEYLGFIRERTEKLYEALGTNFGLPPDVLFMFDLDDENKAQIEKMKAYFQKIKFQQAELIQDEIRYPICP